MSWMVWCALAAAQSSVAEAHGASAALLLPGGDSLSVRAVTARWSMPTGRVVLEGEVELIQASTGLRLSCERLEASLTGDHLETLEAVGAVELRLGARRARAGRASFTPGADRLLLTEGASVQEGDRSLSGDRIELDLKTQQLHCDRCELHLGGP